MSLDAKDYDLGYPIYTWVADDGTNIHIDSPRLRTWTLGASLEVILVPIFRDLAKTFITENICDLAHMSALTPQQRWEPIIFGKRPTFTDGRPDVMLIDGHHRYLRAAIEGETLIRSYLLEIAQWKPFEILNYPQLTQDQLRNAPISAKRSHNYR